MRISIEKGDNNENGRCASREENRKSQKLFPIAIMVEKHGCVLIHLYLQFELFLENIR